jgi:hypothetical protein
MSGDSIYYRDGTRTPTAMGLLQKARARIFEVFTREMRPTPMTKIVDIGVSEIENEGSNYLEKLYPWPDNITCCGLGSGDQIKATYPRINFKHIDPGRSLPFEDKEFDIAYSNAVIEHVGGARQRREFISEHIRLGRAVFIVLPNRWFPVEHHTSLPLLHYWPALFRKSLSKTKLEFWTDPANLEFLDASQVLREWPGKQAPKLIRSGINLGFFSSNIVIVYRPV